MRVLAVGVATLDIINHVACYPAEDSEIRIISQDSRAGGNAANTLCVLSQFGHCCYWLGTLADDESSRFILNNFKHYEIDSSLAVAIAGAHLPVSYISLSRQTGSRSIQHFRNLPELAFDDFIQANLADYDWVHFEGRNIDELGRMLSWAQAAELPIRISLEIEKPRPDIERLFDRADVLFFSQIYAEHKGFKDAQSFLVAMRQQCACSLLFCAWGSLGAAGMQDNELFFVSADKVDDVVDSIAAGDVLNAALIHGLGMGYEADMALQQAVKLAAKKCRQQGLDNLLL
ncbi:MAG: ketohexokinase [gamma proteobacterium symbiont of Bathyaustriella thionipta]|nr:ketohexokinase [gamma proteobacterium symbiont of Bathyaustriella thionipta]